MLLLENIKKSRIIDWNLVYYGFNVLQLMESAGKGIAEAIKRDFPEAKTIAFFCGSGNNAGDAFVAARYLLNSFKVKLFLLTKKEDIKSAAVKNLELLLKSDSKNLKLIQVNDSTELPKRINSDLIVEALVGTALKGKPREPFKSAVNLMNSCKAKKIAVDMPITGFKAEKIYSFIFKKHSKAELIDLGIPREFYFFTGPGNLKFLSKPGNESHKGDNGVITIIAGSKQWHGASIFSGLAATHFTDLIFFLTEKENISFVKKKSAAFIVSELTKKNLIKFIKKSNAVLIGPGLSVNTKNKKLISFVLKHFKHKKFVLDASALRLINLKELNSNCILTPHANEFKELFKLKPSKENIQFAAKKFNCIILLKGKTDLISNGEELYFNFSGNPGMTKGGSGDVLAGLIVSFASMNSLLDSVLAAVFLNGFAGDLLLKEKGFSYSIQDLIEIIPKAFMECVKD